MWSSISGLQNVSQYLASVHKYIICGLEASKYYTESISAIIIC